MGSHTYSAQNLEGFEAPIHGSLGSPILLSGAPRGLAIVNGTLTAETCSACGEAIDPRDVRVLPGPGMRDARRLLAGRTANSVRRTG